MQLSHHLSHHPHASRGVSKPIARGVTALLMFTLSLAAAPSVSKMIKVGQGLYEVAVSESTNNVYVASTGAGNAKVFILDGNTLETKGSIEVGENAPFGLGLNDKTQTLYTSNTRAGNVGVIDLKTNQVIKTLKPEGFENGHVFRVLVDETNNMVYVSAPSQTSQIWVIDGSKNEIVHVIPAAGALTTGLAINPKAKHLYAVSTRDNEVLVFQLGTYELLKKIPTTGERSTHAAYDEKTNRLFVGNQGTGNVIVLDPEKGTVLGSVKAGEGTLGLQFNPATNQVYVANRMSGNVTVIDAKSLEVVAQLQAGTLPNTVAFNRKTNVVYVTNKARRARPAGTKGGGKGEGKGAPPAEAPAAPAPPQPVDESGDTVTMIKP